MANILVNNQSKCWNKKRLANHDNNCRSCYYSQVKNNQWIGSAKCWNACCLEYGGQYKG